MLRRAMRARNIAPKGVANRLTINKRNKRLFLTVSDFNGQGISNGRGVNVARPRQQPFATAKNVAVFNSYCSGVKSLQDQVLPLPRRGQGVGLPRFCHNSLGPRGSTFRATAGHRYDMLPRRQGAVVGLTRLD
jgi:hypothetical protein